MAKTTTRKNSTATTKTTSSKKKPGRKNKTGIAFPNSTRSYSSLSTKEKQKFLNYQKEYVREHYRTFLIRMNSIDDAEIIAWLEEQDNKSECIRQCVVEARKRALKKAAKKDK